ncbi:hypothetical protein PLICRDRAFT_458975 [Plicaturopsis crispa FD-325 SS-3]|nr:hypothetical protein PLICRDRAFT_458975 [Plicaturopsis crispa FD-325 SS-3]
MSISRSWLQCPRISSTNHRPLRDDRDAEASRLWLACYQLVRSFRRICKHVQDSLRNRRDLNISIPRPMKPSSPCFGSVARNLGMVWALQLETNPIYYQTILHPACLVTERLSELCGLLGPTVVTASKSAMDWWHIPYANRDAVPASQAGSSSESPIVWLNDGGLLSTKCALRQHIAPSRVGAVCQSPGC